MSAPKRQRPSLTPNVESIVNDPGRATPAQPEPAPAPAVAVEESSPAQDRPLEEDQIGATRTKRGAPKTKGHAAGARKKAPQSPTKKPRQTQPDGPRPDAGTKGPEDIMSPSNVHIPVILDTPVKAACRDRGITHGELIIIAIEATYDSLDELVNPGTRAGGSLFAARRGRAGRSADGPLTPLNFRMSQADYEVLDRLRDEFGASSRGHLITAALKAYLDVQN